VNLGSLHIDVIPLVFSWPYGLAFWIVSVWVYFPEWRIIRAQTGMGAKSTQDRGSIKVILIGGQLGGMLGFAAAFLLPGATILQYRYEVYWLGVLLLVAAGLLRRHCFRMLGTSFTGAVIVQPDQAIIERGVYKWVRHPSYSAAFLLYISLGVALTNWISILVFLAAASVMYSYRIIVEERALISTLGEPYLSYMRRTKRLIPFIF
jgi:protein-S-isoprenylcysteine O-methyltransferase Ste14